jgi:hypothetical protein
MNRLVRKTGLIAAAVMAVTSSGALLSAGTAYAASADTVTVTPSTGDQDTNTLAFTISSVCPSGTNNFQVVMFGPGIDPAGTLLVGQTAYTNQTTYGSPVTFKDVFVDQGVSSPSGTYATNWQCRNGGNVLKTYTGAVKFTPTAAFSGTYVAAIPTSTTLDAITTPVTYGASSSLSATVSPTDANGKVQFFDGSAPLGAPQTLNASGVATSSATLPAGSHSITAAFVPNSGAAHTASTSDPQTVVVNQGATTATLSASPASTQTQYSSVTFTATLGSAIPGNVNFKSDGTTIGGCATQAVSGTTATCSTSGLAQGTHLISVVFTPTDTTNYSSYSTPAGQELSYQITAPSAFAQDYEDISATVIPGSLLISVADHNVNLGTATINSAGDLFVAQGTLNPVTITDTRAGDTGWTSSGVLTGLPTQPSGANGDFVGQNDNTHRVNKFNLGWTPSIYTVGGVPQIAAHQTGLHLGGPVSPASQQTGGTTPSDSAAGLGSARSFASADAGKGSGTVKLVADLTLNIPTSVQPDTYTSRLTFTVTG